MKWAKVDDNQKEIVAGLRACGCSVTSLASLGKGVFDLLVGRNGLNYIMEVKDLSKPSVALTDDEIKWMDSWKGQKCVVCNLEDAIQVIEHNELIYLGIGG